MFGRRRLSVTAALGTAHGIEPRDGGRGRTRTAGRTGTIEAGRREAQRCAPATPGRTLFGRLARRRALAAATRGAG